MAADGQRVSSAKANKMSVVGTVLGVTGTRKSLIRKSFCYCACQFSSPFCKVSTQKSAIYFGPNLGADVQRVSSCRGHKGKQNECGWYHIRCNRDP